MKYGFIGFGNLAKAIYQGLSEDRHTFAFVDKNNNKHDGLEMLYSLEELVNFSDVIWLCVKPQDIIEVLEKIKEFDLKDKVFISPVAGKGIGFFENYLGKDIAIVRIMPNLNIAYKKSVTAFCTNKVDNLLVREIKRDLKKLGEVAEIGEDKFDLFTAIFGSGPAFLLEIFKVFKDKMSKLGIEGTKANDLLIQFVDGTLTYFKKNTEKDIPELINNIASRGGVTEAGLDSFRENNIEKSLNDVLSRAEKKSEEMGK